MTQSSERRPAAVAQGDREPRLTGWLLPLIALLVIGGLAIALMAGLGQDKGTDGAESTPTPARMLKIAAPDAEPLKAHGAYINAPSAQAR